jgi:hypothetical protein
MQRNVAQPTSTEQANRYDRCSDDTLITTPANRVVFAAFVDDWLLYVVQEGEGFRGGGRWRGRELISTSVYRRESSARETIAILAAKADVGGVRR